jgi:hypothetical protein
MQNFRQKLALKDWREKENEKPLTLAALFARIITLITPRKNNRAKANFRGF